MKKIWLVLIGITLTFSASAAKFTEGKQYISLPRPVAGEPKVIEFFSFFCSHCYQFEEIYHVSDTVKKNLPPDIKIVKYHVDFLGGDFGRVVMNAWAVAMALGVEDQVASPIFDGIQKTQTITDAVSLKEAFIKAVGISSQDYDSAWNSFAVRALVVKQQKAASDIKLHGVPAILIDGKYMVNNSGLDTSSMHSFVADYVNLVKFLVKKK